MKAKIIDTNEIYEFEGVYLKDNPNSFYQRWDGKLYYPHDLDFYFTEDGERYIKELSREYSEYMCPPEDYIDDEERKSFKYDLKIEVYITKEIIAGNINFLTLMNSYFKYVEKQKEINRCEKIEMATLLTLNELGIKIPQQKEREIHMMAQYSNMNINDLKEKYHYDEKKMTEDFKKRFNL